MKLNTLTPEQADWLDATFARNRATYAGWTMEADSDASDDAAAETSGDSDQQQGTDSGAGDESGDVTDGEKTLGDAGKKALDAMKAERNQSREELKALRSEFEAFRAKAEGTEAEHAAALEQQQIKDEALAAANKKILKAEVKGIAKGMLADPADALTFIDLDQFEVGDDGDVNVEAVKAALDELIQKKPYLAVQDGRRFQGDADGGARKESSASIDQQIADAEKAGDHARVISLKRAKAHANN